MIDGILYVPNARSPGTPVCHPDDEHRPPAPDVCIRPKSLATIGDSEYIELHAGSAFSFLAGASQPEALMERAAELNMPAMALADRNGLYGVARFHTAGARSGIKYPNP